MSARAIMPASAKTVVFTRQLRADTAWDVAFVRRYLDVIALTDKVAAGQIQCGLHSGFPECCILFFVTTWRDWWNRFESDAAGAQVAGALVQDHNRMIPPGTDYVPCPTCLHERSFASVRKCPDGAHKRVTRQARRKP